MRRVDQIEACARAAHEVNRAYCVALGDKSQPPWDEATVWQIQSCRKGVEGVLAGNTPEQSHESWLAEKRATGWKYGPIKNVETKTHPCMLPYDALPPDQQQKDQLFVSTVRSMATALGMTVGVDSAPELWVGVDATDGHYNITPHVELTREACEHACRAMIRDGMVRIVRYVPADRRTE